jgi:hypothetical protein
MAARASSSSRRAARPEVTAVRNSSGSNSTSPGGSTVTGRRCRSTMTTPNTTAATTSAMSRPHSVRATELAGAPIFGEARAWGRRLGWVTGNGGRARDGLPNRCRWALIRVRMTTAISPAVRTARSQRRSRATVASSPSGRSAARRPRISVAVSSTASTTAKTAPTAVPSRCSGPSQCGTASAPRRPIRVTAISRSTSGIREAAGRRPAGVPRPRSPPVSSSRNILRSTIRRPVWPLSGARLLSDRPPGTRLVRCAGPARDHSGADPGGPARSRSRRSAAAG